MGQGDGFLNRWSRRKLAEKEREDEPQHASLPATPDADDAAALNAEAETPERHPAEDIDIDSLSRDFDFSVFLQKGVPAAIKQKALRKLWGLDPVLREPEKLTDMFNIADTKTWGLGPLRGTSWRVGEGYGWRDVLPEVAEEPDPQETVAEAEPEEPEDTPQGDRSAQDGEAEDEVAGASPPEDDNAEDDGKA